MDNTIKFRDERLGTLIKSSVQLTREEKSRIHDIVESCECLNEYIDTVHCTERKLSSEFFTELKFDYDSNKFIITILTRR